MTNVMATIQVAYFKGRMEGHPLWVHESLDDGASISIDLYHFGGDGEPVCGGLKTCTITHEDGTTTSDEVFCMHYDPDDEHPLTFIVDGGPLENGDMNTYAATPEQLPEKVLSAISLWLNNELKKGQQL